MTSNSRNRKSRSRLTIFQRPGGRDAESLRMTGDFDDDPCSRCAQSVYLDDSNSGVKGARDPRRAESEKNLRQCNVGGI